MTEARVGDTVVAIHTVTPGDADAPSGWQPVGVVTDFALQTAARDRPQLALTLEVRVARHPRGKCSHCGLRRILFSVVASGDPASLSSVESARLCAIDAGIGR